MKTKLKFSANSSYYLFLIDISKKNHSYELDSVQSEYLNLISNLNHVAIQTLTELTHNHRWYFVFALLKQQSEVLLESLAHGPLGDNTQHIRHLVAVYNALAGIRPWRPPKNRFLAWLNAPNGWEEEIRCLVCEQPPTETVVRKSVQETFVTIERLLYISNDVTARWGT